MYYDVLSPSYKEKAETVYLLRMVDINSSSSEIIKPTIGNPFKSHEEFLKKNLNESKPGTPIKSLQGFLLQPIYVPTTTFLTNLTVGFSPIL